MSIGTIVVFIILGYVYYYIGDKVASKELERTHMYSRERMTHLTLFWPLYIEDWDDIF